MTLSRRGQRLVESPPFPDYLHEHFARRAAPSEPGHEYVPLCVAENLLLGDRLMERLAAVPPPPTSVLAYDAMVGSEHFRQRLASFLGHRVLGRPCPPEHLAVLGGAGSVLEIVFHNLCDPGDGVLVPTPSYAGFWADLETRDQLNIVPVHTRADDGFQLTPELLDRAMAEAARPVKALLLTTPDNPRGKVYTREELEIVLAWAEHKQLHVVVDEIYALSIHGDQPFVSAAQLSPTLGDHVHIVWAFSKDFGASGLRCGVLVTENQDLVQATDALAYWACVSGHTQHLLAELLGDTPWLDAYIQENQSILRQAYKKVTTALDAQGISHVPAGAGFFLLCDLRQYLDAPTWDAEQALWRKILEQSNVNLTPGSACRVGEPGFMRLCFAAVESDVVVGAVERMGEVVGG